MFSSLSNYVWAPEMQGTDPGPGNVKLDDSKVTEDGWVFVEEIALTEGGSPTEFEQDVGTQTPPQQIFFEKNEEEQAGEGESSSGESKASSPVQSEDVSPDVSLQRLLDETRNQGQSDSAMETADESPETSSKASLQFALDEDLELVDMNETENHSTAQATAGTTTVTIGGGCEFEFVLPAVFMNTQPPATVTPPQPASRTMPPIREHPAVSMRITRSQRRMTLAMELGARARERPLTRSQSAALRRRAQREKIYDRPQTHSHGKKKRRAQQKADRHSGRGGRRGC